MIPNQRDPITFRVSAAESGQKLLAVLKDKVDGYSSKQLKKMIEENACQVNSKIERFASSLVFEQDLIVFYPAEKKAILAVSKKDILFEDDSLLVYNKPQGICSDGQEIAKLFPHFFLVHRLDKWTTGALILAKKEAVLKLLIEAFKRYEVKKSYLTIVDGQIKQKSGIIENFLGKIKTCGGKPVFGEVAKQKGLYACTEWEKNAQGKNETLLTCKPKTGRTHQIRVHMSEMGHPILGDFQYGHSFVSSYKPPFILLHAYTLVFAHPLTQQTLKIKAPLPDAFSKAINTLFGIGNEIFDR